MYDDLHRMRALWHPLLILAVATGLVACGPDRDKLAKDVQEKMRAEMQAKIRAEVEARLRAELPKLEARLRAQLTGKKLPTPLKPDPGATTNKDPAKQEPAVSPEPIKPDPAKPDPAKPDPATTAEPKPDTKGLTVNRVVIAKQVKDRKAVAVGTEFTVADGRVYCYVDAANAKGPERMLNVAWIRNGKRFHAVRLRVGKGSVWRTWAFLRLRETSVGSWQCAVHNEEGLLIGRTAFTVK